jgi:hypothetical protein
MGEMNENKLSAKEKLAHALRKLFAPFLYLAGFFTVFRLYKAGLKPIEGGAIDTI